MPTIADYLNDLKAQQTKLAEIISSKGVEAEPTELLNSLVPKVNDVYNKGIESGGGSGSYEEGFEDGKNSVTIYDLAENLTWGDEGYVIYRGMAPTGSGYCKEVETVNVVTIPSFAFYGYDSLVTAIIGNKTEYIRNNAFYNCKMLKTITFPNTLKAIYTTVFRNCTSLDNVHLPKSITSINAEAFNGCTGIKTLTVEEGFNCSLPLNQCSALTVDSVVGIINNYKNASGKTLTVHSNVFAQLTEDILATATNKGLTIAEA